MMVGECDEELWGTDLMWILYYDNVMKHPGGRVKGCRCDVHRRPGEYIMICRLDYNLKVL